MLFMSVGRSAPRYQEIAELYPRCKDLQSYMFEYFIVVVRLCHQCLRFTQKSALGQFTSTLIDSEMRTYQSELDSWAKSIKEAVFLQIAKTMEAEAQGNSHIRTVSKKIFESTSSRQKVKLKRQLLELCSKFDYDAAWKQTRKVGNATLFHEAAEYQAWKGRADSCTLVCLGKLGCGKSVLLANIVDDLSLHVRDEDITIAYFFCRHDIRESLNARTIIGSLARQLLCSVPDLSIATGFLDRTSTSALDFSELFDLIKRTVPPNRKIYFVLDGLDECDFSEQDILLEEVKRLQNTFLLLLCISLRPDPNNASKLIPEQFNDATVFSIPDDNPDIETFIQTELEARIESRKLVLGNPALVLEIRNALLEGSRGMFLWVALQIESLCTMRTDDEIREALMDLPEDLSETFSRILQRSEGSEGPCQKRILKLVTVARRPLTAEELREALSVVPENTIWDPGRLLNDIHKTLSCCGCLLTFDEEEFTVRLVHHSFRQFILGASRNSTKVIFTMDSAEENMADTMITYLSYSVFDTQVSTTVAPQMVIGSAPSAILRSTLGPSSKTRSLALRFLRSRTPIKHDVGKNFAEASKLIQPRLVDEFRFLYYAKTYCLQHVSCTVELKPAIYNLLLRLVKKNALNIDVMRQDHEALLLRAVLKGDDAVVQLLLATKEMDVTSKDDNGQTAIARALHYSRNAAVVKLLLATGKVGLDLKDIDGRTPLSHAAGSRVINAVSTVTGLLETGKVDVDSKDAHGRAPLSYAARQGNDAIVKLLLATGKVDIDLKDDLGRTSLSYAAEILYNRGAAVITRLLETGKVDVDSKDYRSHTPLIYAARQGNDAIVKSLLATGRVDIDSKNNVGATPLLYATQNGQKTVAELLLATGKVDVNAKDKDGRTPLSYAAERFYTTIVELIMATGQVDVEEKDK